MNIGKIELILLNPRMEELDIVVKLKLNGKSLYPTKYVKYLGIKIDKSLTWNEHVSGIAIKLN